MDYTPPSSSSSYKGSNSSNSSELEFMRRISSYSSNNTTNPSSTSRLEVVEEDDDGGVEGGGNKKSVVIEREHMFDKVVTPSDVGKLNRLVIPKQHAEKYFPLDSSNNEKGLLLNFEDRTGKPWRFRYSYWNSSQSYVMTKGWSRFVKEKKLDAGDIVSFQRGVGDVGKDKLFIDWRRRPENTSGLLPYPNSVGGSLYHHHSHGYGRTGPAGLGWGTSGPPFVLRSQPHPNQHQGYSYPLGLQGGPSGMWDHHHQGLVHFPHSSLSVLPSTQSNHYQSPRRGTGLGGGSSSGGGGYGFGFGNVVNPYPVIFLRPSTGASNSSLVQNGVSSTLSLSSTEDQQRGSPLMMMQVHGEEGGDEGMIYESVPVVQGKAAAKRLRLFGVNMDCPISHQTHDFDILSSSLASSQHQQNELQQHVAISMGPPLSPPTSQSHSHHHHHHNQNHQVKPYNGSSSSSVPIEKGKSSTSSSMSLDLDI